MRHYNQLPKTSLREVDGKVEGSVIVDGNSVVDIQEIVDVSRNVSQWMPATPSGDPMHYMYVACGAVWNGDTGYWELNGLTDLTNEDVRTCYAYCNMVANKIVASHQYKNVNFRTNMWKVIEFSSEISSQFSNAFRVNRTLEILNISSINISAYSVANADYAFQNCVKLRKIIGAIRFSSSQSATHLSGIFNNCKELQSARLKNVNSSISIKWSAQFDKESLLYLIENAGTSAFTVTVHPDVYAWASTDEDIQNALTNKTNITLQTE